MISLIKYWYMTEGALNKYSVSFPLGAIELKGEIAVPEHAHAIVLFAHGSGSSRLSPRNQLVASYLNKQGIATCVFDLLTEEEDRNVSNRFNIELLAQRLEDVTKWISSQDSYRHMRLGYFGASTGAAAAFMAARDLHQVSCIVSRGGRPDLVMKDLPFIRIPVLLIVGENDVDVIEFNKQAFEKLQGEKLIEIIPSASHLFEEPGAMEKVCVLAANWFRFHMEPLELVNA
jgi:dienelactone hydrolase